MQLNYFRLLSVWNVHISMQFFFQVRLNAFDIFGSVQSQVCLPSTYTVEDMQRDMVTYMKRNKDELEVFYLVT